MIKKKNSIKIFYKVNLVIFYIFFSNPCFAYEPVNKNLSQNARDLFNYFESIYQKKTLAGYNVYPHTPDIYEQTGKHGAIWARDIEWFGNPKENVKHVQKMGYILTIHWHWHFDKDSAWTNKRKAPVDLKRIVTPGSLENEKMLAELKLAADKLQLFADADIPILWRPLHEIDGGWFWWTDTKNPENSAELWRIIFHYMVNERQLNNLIWVYSASVRNRSVEERKKYYPGSEYVDISGGDLYEVNVKTDNEKYLDYYNAMAQVSPGKMLALGEADAIPNPEFRFEDYSFRWLYVLPWWGSPHPKRPVDWANYTMRHEDIVTLDELPRLGSENISPSVGITFPIDKGSTWYSNTLPKFEIYANDMDGSIKSVALYANEKLTTEKSTAPFTFNWDEKLTGSYQVKAIATDDMGNQTISNSIRIVVGKADIARNKNVFTSSGKKNSQYAVDGDIYSYWSADKTDEAWLYVDLENGYLIDNINLYFGWKIHPEEITVDIANDSPELPDSWTTIHTEKNIPYTQWKLSLQMILPEVNARFVKINFKKRAGNQNWGGFKLASLEIPIELAEMPSLPAQVKNKFVKFANNVTKNEILILIMVLILLLTIYIKYVKFAPPRLSIKNK